MLCSGTAIGVNEEKAIREQSKANFLCKLSVAYKKTKETLYWLKLLFVPEYLAKEMSESLIKDAAKNCRIIGKIQISTKQL
jgi:four helix bundle protein